jgi:hypothetical protein
LLPHFPPIVGVRRIGSNLTQASEKISPLFAATLAVELAWPVVRDPGKTNKEREDFRRAIV